MASINFSDDFQLEEKLWVNENGFKRFPLISITRKKIIF